MVDQTVGHQYARWKSSIPFLYDWFTHHKLTWPSITCRWGSVSEESTYKTEHNVFLSERTGDSKDPNRLLVVPVQIVKPRIAAAETIAGFNEEKPSQFVKAPISSIIHPGEVNKIREIPDHSSIVATHSDAKEVYIWHFDRQPNRSEHKVSPKPSVPDLTLTGHEDEAQFALSTTTGGPVVASGGSDKNVLLWDLRDYEAGSLLRGGLQPASDQSPQLAARHKLAGHTETVEEVILKPGSTEEVGSVADDGSIIFWDVRTGLRPCNTIANAHNGQDVQCIDWSKLEPFSVVTGAADGTLKIWDRRKTDASVYSSGFHTRALLRVQFATYRPGILASGGYDGVVCVWDLNNKSQPYLETASEAARAQSHPPPEVIFQHAGHRAQIADFQWHPTDPFTMMSVSENDEGKGGTLQLWRIHDFVWRPEAEVIAELQQIRDKLLSQTQAAKQNNVPIPARQSGSANNSAEPNKLAGSQPPQSKPNAPASNPSTSNQPSISQPAPFKPKQPSPAPQIIPTSQQNSEPKLEPKDEPMPDAHTLSASQPSNLSSIAPEVTRQGPPRQ